jgi:hypothetical protein
MAWLGRELGGLTGQELAKELHQDPAVLSRGLGKLAEELASKPELRGVVETLYDSLRKERRPKKINKVCLTTRLLHKSHPMDYQQQFI